MPTSATATPGGAALRAVRGILDEHDRGCFGRLHGATCQWGKGEGARVGYLQPRPAMGEEEAGPPGDAVTRGERLPMLDVLRGVALLGILVVNVDDWYAPEWLKDVPFAVPVPAFVGWHAHLDIVILCLKWLFVEGKMRGLFATLFGAGVVLLTDRIERRGAADRAADIFCRRNLWLLLFGLLHGILIWPGDVLSTYALLALLFLFPFRRWPGRRLVALGLGVWLVLGTLGTLNVWEVPATVHRADLVAAATVAQRQGVALTPEQQAAVAAARHRPADIRAKADKLVALSRQSYAESLGIYAKAYLDNVADCLTSGDDFEMLGAMFLGMGLFKVGFLTGRLSRRRYALIALAGYGVSMPLVLGGLAHLFAVGFSDVSYMVWLQGPYCFAQVSAMLANASVIMLLARTRPGAAILRPFGAVGQTAFSNYIMTSLICQTLFFWSGLGLYGHIEYHQSMLVVLAVWGIDLVASTLWLRHFAFGPLEWAWRSLTYWRRQPFRSRAASTRGMPAAALT